MELTERQKLEQISLNSLYAAGANSATVRYSYEIAHRHLRCAEVLEMGPAEGVMTELLAASGRRVTAVEASSFFCDSLKQRFPQIKVANALFEDYEPDAAVEDVVLGHVLEHVRTRWPS